MKLFSAKLLVAAVLVSVSMRSQRMGARQKAGLHAELAAYSGPDREQRLVAGAKAEGKVVWYTSLAGSSYKEIAKGFETKYPGIKVETYRGTSTDIMTRISAEAQAKQILADVLETTVPPLTYLRENKLLAAYNSPHLGQVSGQHKRKRRARTGLLGGRSRNLQRRRLQHDAYPAAAVPKNYDDLLKPELKGKIGFVSNETGVRALGAMLKVKGEEFVKKLKSQEIVLQSVSGRAMADLVVSGEVPLVADDLPRPCDRAQRQRSAGGMGADGCRADQHRRRRDHGPRGASACRPADGRFSSQPRRGKNSQRPGLWQPTEANEL